MDNIENPFKAKTALARSPVKTISSNANQITDDKLDMVINPFNASKSLMRSPVQGKRPKTTNIDNNNDDSIINKENNVERKTNNLQEKNVNDIYNNDNNKTSNNDSSTIKTKSAPKDFKRTYDLLESAAAVINPFTSKKALNRTPPSKITEPDLQRDEIEKVFKSVDITPEGEIDQTPEEELDQTPEGKADQTEVSEPGFGSGSKEKNINTDFIHDKLKITDSVVEAAVIQDENNQSASLPVPVKETNTKNLVIEKENYISKVVTIKTAPAPAPIMNMKDMITASINSFVVKKGDGRRRNNQKTSSSTLTASTAASSSSSSSKQVVNRKSPMKVTTKDNKDKDKDKDKDKETTVIKPIQRSAKKVQNKDNGFTIKGKSRTPAKERNSPKKDVNAVTLSTESSLSPLQATNPFQPKTSILRTPPEMKISYPQTLANPSATEIEFGNHSDELQNKNDVICITETQAQPQTVPTEQQRFTNIASTCNYINNNHVNFGNSTSSRNTSNSHEISTTTINDAPFAKQPVIEKVLVHQNLQTDGDYVPAEQLNEMRSTIENQEKTSTAEIQAMKKKVLEQDSECKMLSNQCTESEQKCKMLEKERLDIEEKRRKCELQCAVLESELSESLNRICEIQKDFEMGKDVHQNALEFHELERVKKAKERSDIQMNIFFSKEKERQLKIQMLKAKATNQIIREEMEKKEIEKRMLQAFIAKTSNRSLAIIRKADANILQLQANILDLKKRCEEDKRKMKEALYARSYTEEKLSEINSTFQKSTENFTSSLENKHECLASLEQKLKEAQSECEFLRSNYDEKVTRLRDEQLKEKGVLLEKIKDYEMKLQQQQDNNAETEKRRAKKQVNENERATTNEREETNDENLIKKSRKRKIINDNTECTNLPKEKKKSTESKKKETETVSKKVVVQEDSSTTVREKQINDDDFSNKNLNDSKNDKSVSKNENENESDENENVNVKKARKSKKDSRSKDNKDKSKILNKNKKNCDVEKEGRILNTPFDIVGSSSSPSKENTVAIMSDLELSPSPVPHNQPVNTDDDIVTENAKEKSPTRRTLKSKKSSTLSKDKAIGKKISKAKKQTTAVIAFDEGEEKESDSHKEKNAVVCTGTVNDNDNDNDDIFSEHTVLSVPEQATAVSTILPKTQKRKLRGQNASNDFEIDNQQEVNASSSSLSNKIQKVSSSHSTNVGSGGSSSSNANAVVENDLINKPPPAAAASSSRSTTMPKKKKSVFNKSKFTTKKKSLFASFVDSGKICAPKLRTEVIKKANSR